MPSPASMRPKTAAQQGIPAMLQQFTAEWDAMMLETFTLKQKLTVAQQQISDTLYRQDAACRVIARLTKENETLKRELGAVRSGSSSGNGMDVDVVMPSGASVLPNTITKRMEIKTSELSAARSNRKIGPSVATRDKVAAYQSSSHQAPHKTSIISCMDVTGDLIITGAADKHVTVTDKNTGKSTSKLACDKKPVAMRAVAVGAGLRIVAASEDGVLHSWVSADKTGDAFEVSTTLKVKDSAVTSIDIHPIGDVALVGLKDGSCALVDLSTETVYPHTHSKLSSPVTSIRFHPDGEIFATAGEDGLIHVWNVASFAHMATFTGHTGAVVDINFSENGYSLASTSKDQTLKIWDLEQIGQCNTVQLSAQPHSLSYDFSGRFLAVSVTSGAKNANKEIRVFTGKNVDLVASFETSGKGDVTAVRWGPDAQWVSFAQDKNIHFWSA